VSRRDDVLAELLERCRRDHQAWINGDGSPYGLPDDGTILGAVGAYRFGGEETRKLQVAVAAQWQSGIGSVELLNGSVEGNVAWLVMIERASVTLLGEQDVRRWDLRVTEIFRDGPDGWERVHRHADPLVDRHPLPDLVALLDRAE
jgi:hypothetical protein